MSAVQHTPGPWTISESVWPDFAFHIEGESFRPASIWRDGKANHGTSQANANLIATTPELLSLAEAIVRLTEGGNRNIDRTAVEILGQRARAVVAKATGKQVQK